MTDHGAGSFLNWTILKAENDGLVALYRVRLDRPDGLDEFSTLVTIGWRYSDADPNGFPPEDVAADMDTFEDDVSDLSGDNGLSELVLVITGMGTKEWSFYTRDYPEFMAVLNRLLSGRPKAPVEVTFCEDPDWEYWHDIRRHAG
jgi:hypothetical protein